MGTARQTEKNIETRPGFRELSRRMMGSLDPMGEAELRLAMRILRDTWLLQCASDGEEELFARGCVRFCEGRTGGSRVALANGRTSVERSRTLERAGFSEHEVRSRLHRDYAAFRELQAERNRPETNYVAYTGKIKERPEPPMERESGYDEAGYVASNAIAETVVVLPERNPEPQVVTWKSRFVPRWYEKLPPGSP